MTNKKCSVTIPKQFKDCKVISLALQGGGSYGAFTWGVLDRLLQDERIFIEGISATSAGSMNAAVMTYGLLKSRKDARELLEQFWFRVSRYSLVPPMLYHLLGKIAIYYSPLFLYVRAMSNLISPDQYNLISYNPLKDILNELVDFEVLRKTNYIKLFINATSASTGKIKIFFSDELTVDMLLASACLPSYNRSVRVGKDVYWDGGFSGNPAIYPLSYKCDTKDIMIVQINPLQVYKMPFFAHERTMRQDEVAFNAAIMRELRHLAVLKKMLRQGVIEENKSVYRDLNIHMIYDEILLNQLDRSNKFNTDWHFLNDLKKAGQDACDLWLKENFDKLGTDSTVDIEKVFI